MLPAIATLALGIILGYLAQRSRICFIGGLRDFILVRDAELLKGAIAFFVTAWLAFSVAGAVGLLDWQTPAYRAQPAAAVAAAPAAGESAPARSGAATGIGLPNWRLWALTAAAGLALGLVSTLANGCPTRQHVLAAQGLREGLFYLIGFYLGVIVYYLATKPLIALFI